MDSKTLTTGKSATRIIIPRSARGDRKHRLAKFAAWMDAQGRQWYEPDLAAYRDHLLTTLAPSSASAHLSTVRARYATILRNDTGRDELYALAGERLRAQGRDDTPANREALVGHLITRLENALVPESAPVTVTTPQDRPESGPLRLTSEQASVLMAAPGIDTLTGLRDTAIIALMLCTGIRETELSALNVEDLHQRLGEDLALQVREGKGRRERLIPYGELSWVLDVVDAWMEAAGITEGAVFRGLYKGGRRLRPGRLSVRAIQYIVTRYPVSVEGELVRVAPGDLRRSYAARLYHAGVDLVAIQQNLGHADVKTTLGYIGELDASKRRAPQIYSFSLDDLPSSSHSRA